MGSREEVERSSREAPGDSRSFCSLGEVARGTWYTPRPYPGAGCPLQGRLHLWHLLQVREGAEAGREGWEEEREEGLGWEGTREAWVGRGVTVAAAWRVGEVPAGAWRLASQA